MLQRRACVMQSSCLCVSIHFPYFITRERQNSWLPSPRTEIAKSLKLPLWLKWILIPPSGDKWAETPWVFGVTGWRSGSSLNSLRGTTCPPPLLLATSRASYSHPYAYRSAVNHSSDINHTNRMPKSPCHNIIIIFFVYWILHIYLKLCRGLSTQLPIILH